MARIVKCGLIQATNAGALDAPMEDIKRANLDKHLDLIEEAANQGVQILCMQEVFTTPYFCAEQQTRWYEAVERIPDGPTVKVMQDVARDHGMVIIVPIYEEEITGVYYNTANTARTTFRTSRRDFGKSSISNPAIWAIRVLTRRLRASAFTSVMTGTFPKAHARSV
jgi:hypothetical protein